MSYLGSTLGSALGTIFYVALIATVGYLVGRIKIKGIALGTAGVLLIALLFGIFASYYPYITVGETHIPIFIKSQIELEDGTVLAATSKLFSLISSLGTALFVTSIGLIAGPKFFRTFNKANIGYILMGVMVIIIGALTGVAFILFSSDPDVNSSLVTGLMTGALTSTPGLSAATEVASDTAKVTAGYGIAYIFGVLGVVLFVQIIPRIMHVNMEEERANFEAANAIEIPQPKGNLIRVDDQSYFPVFLSIVLGCLIGAIKIPGINFSLGTSGGTLISGLILGHFGHVGRFDVRVPNETLNSFRELGLVLFLIGAGVPGGVNFIANLKLSYFLVGAVITIVPMVVGLFIGKYIFKMSIFNNLGSITGGMTSTPALGTLIATAGTHEVTAAYASTYPFALVCVVLAAKIICIVFP